MLFFETARAFAQEAAPAPQGGPLSLFQSPLTMLLFIFIIFYFLLIRPQQKKQRSHQDMLKKLDKGDKIITTGGIHGTIVSLDDKVITLQVDEKVRLKISRNAVAGVSSLE
jgi:preprotein translocase subunit YajC